MTEECFVDITETKTLGSDLAYDVTINWKKVTLT